MKSLEMTIKQLTDAFEIPKAEIAEMQMQLKRAGEDCVKQNNEFQVTVADQRATQRLLQAALTVLKSFYEKKDVDAFMQKHKPIGSTPPPGFNTT